ncbi:hypothetical protein D9M68_707320 [compost metagenome]
MGQAFALGQQEGGARLGLEAIEHQRDALQQFEDQLALLGRGRLGLGQVGQGFEVGALQFLAAPVIDHQAAGHGAQEGARSAQVEAVAFAEQAQEGVLRQVGGIGGIAQLAAQPVLQPAVMLAVQRLDGEMGRGHEGHREMRYQMKISRIFMVGRGFCNLGCVSGPIQSSELFLRSAMPGIGL